MAFGMNHHFLRTKQFCGIFEGISKAYQIKSSFTTSNPCRKSLEAKPKSLDKALKFLDFVNPKINKATRDDCHKRLIQICMNNLLDPNHQQCAKSISDYDINTDIFASSSTKLFVEEDSLSQFDALLRRGIRLEATALSSFISSCGAKGSFGGALQIHAFSMKISLNIFVSVGSSLISIYSKYGNLDDACKVFHDMPMNHTVSCTAIMSVYAQHGQLETCLYLFNSMRHSNVKPNDFTYSCLLSVCTNCTSLALGRAFHSLQIRIGYVSHTHVSNALISMYSKCGIIEEARNVFKKLQHRDLISWNSMIFGYAHYGLADQALNLFEEMEKNNMFLDAITFLGVLSSCRHAGLVNKGRYYFNLMLKYGIKPKLDHCSCIVDLLGRAGLVEEAVKFIEKMPVTPNAIIWGSLLSSCRVHGNIWIGIHAAEKRLLLEPGCAATHVQLANLYASIGFWNDVAKIRKLMKEMGLKTTPGHSWIEIGKRVYRFRAEDGTNEELNDMLELLDTLGDHMQYMRLDL